MRIAVLGLDEDPETRPPRLSRCPEALVRARVYPAGMVAFGGTVEMRTACASSSVRVRSV